LRTREQLLSTNQTEQTSP